MIPKHLIKRSGWEIVSNTPYATTVVVTKHNFGTKRKPSAYQVLYIRRKDYILFWKSLNNIHVRIHNSILLQCLWCFKQLVSKWTDTSRGLHVFPLFNYVCDLGVWLVLYFIILILRTWISRLINYSGKQFWLFRLKMLANRMNGFVHNSLILIYF